MPPIPAGWDKDEWAEAERKLRAPIPADKIQWRVQGTPREDKRNPGHMRAQVLAYLDARDVMDILDDAFGIGGWSDEFTPLVVDHPPATDRNRNPPLALMVGLYGITVRGITKHGVGDYGQGRVAMHKATDSDAYKRAAVKWIPSYRKLYELQLQLQ